MTKVAELPDEASAHEPFGTWSELIALIAHSVASCEAMTNSNCGQSVVEQSQHVASFPSCSLPGIADDEGCRGASNTDGQ